MLSTAPLLTRATINQEQAGSLLGSLEGYRLFIAANRAPFHHKVQDGKPMPVSSGGGLVTALSSLAGILPLTWLATASGPGDGLVHYLPQRPALPGSPRLKYVPVPEDVLAWFYGRFSNPVLWFLQHGMWDRLHPASLAEAVEYGWLRGYLPVNRTFAEALGREIVRVPHPVVITHDYHFYLLPSLLRRLRRNALLQHFTHIPWPAPDLWEPLQPSIRRDMHKGLLGADIVGFQTQDSARNFLRSCERFVPEAHVDHLGGAVWLKGRKTQVRAYPISVDPSSIRRLAQDPRTLRHKDRLLPQLGRQTIVRVDRMDPSKNIGLGFRAFGLLLERKPDLAGRVRFLAFLVPSRESIPEYQSYAREVWEEVERVNARFSRGDWKPIEVFYEENRPQAMAGMALADVLLVNPVADGMNLVAKEGPLVSEREAVLILSKNCGAHRQLAVGALSVDPVDVDATAEAFERALEMTMVERRRRASMLRAAIESEDLSWWIRRQLTDLFDG